jgi:hypothetical protein
LISKRRAREFFETYRTAFERYDAAAIADLFAYPSHVTGDAAEVALTPVTSREAWVGQLERLLALYRAIGAVSARPAQLTVVELSPWVLQALVHWELTDQNGAALYDFQAAYTLVELGGALRISSVAHNEVPRYRACLARLQAGGSRAGAGPGPGAG